MKQVVTFLYVVLCSFALKAQDSITTYQFWFDRDYVNAQTGSLADSLFQMNIPTTGLLAGPHIFYYRVREQNGQWSSVIEHPFLKPVSTTTHEYWFDQQYSNRISMTLPPDSVIQLNQLVQTAALPKGEHVLHTRFMDELGKWSAVVSQTFVIDNQLDAYEYWFDNDYANKTTQFLPTPVDVISLDTLISNIPHDKIHQVIHVRFHQQKGTWTTAISQEFGLQNKIIAYEYWFNNQYASKINTSVSPVSPLLLQPTIDASTAPLGSNIVHIRFQDAAHRWSSIISEGFCRNAGDSAIHLKLFLQGYYSGNGQMLPVMLNEGVGSNPLLVDSIQVSLHASSAPYTKLSTTTVPLNTDGAVSCNFPWNFVGNYYLGITHRNTIETWTAVPIYRGTCPTYYDFTTQATSAFGSNMTELEAGTWGFYTGDINQDENIDLLDVSILDADINAFQFGYFGTDINGDGNVDLLDGPVLEGNVNQFIFSAHP